MPRGGSRPGAGRKPKTAKVVGMDGKPRADVLPPSMQGTVAATATVTAPDSQPSLIEPPADLSEPRKAFWREWAPQAIAAGTLTEETVLGFRELAEQYVIKANLATAVENQAPGWGESLKLWIKATQRVDSSMARFKLTALGKSAPPKPKTASSNPWASVGGPVVKR